jgi:hypothetical protein
MLRKLAAQRMAAEAPGQTLQVTALVHEAHLRLVDANQAQPWTGRGHFFAAAAEAMRPGHFAGRITGRADHAKRSIGRLRRW